MKYYLHSDVVKGFATPESIHFIFFIKKGHPKGIEFLPQILNFLIPISLQPNVVKL